MLKLDEIPFFFFIMLVIAINMKMCFICMLISFVGTLKTILKGAYGNKKSRVIGVST